LQYRFLPADRFYVGHDYAPSSIPTPNKLPIRYRINTLGARLEYAISDRVSVALTLAGATGTESREEGDAQRHTLSATGLGDAAVVGSFWLLDPLDHSRGNLGIGLGVKAPTGSYRSSDNFYTATGVERRPVDPAIQPGDGAWGEIVQVQGFQAITGRVVAYAAGSYLANPSVHTSVIIRPPAGGTDFVSVADEYSAHAGISYFALPNGGLSLSLGGRIDGVPVRDLLGASDTSFRRPGYVEYVEPAISLTLMRNPFSLQGSTFTLSVPIAVDQNRKASTFDIAHGKHGGGDFARFLIFLGYSKRL